MKLLRRRRPARDPERGSALLMAFLMVILLYAIVFQLAYGTNADLRVATNDVTNTQIELAVESALMEVYDRLRQDGEAAAAGGEEGGAPIPGGEAGAPGGPPAGGEGGGEETPASDSREDSWGRPQRTTIGDVELRILVQDEDSKINVLTMLTEDEAEAEKAFDRIVRVIDMFRDGSTVDVDRSEAYRIVEQMRQHLRNRANSVLPKPRLASDDEDEPDLGMPLTLEEFEVLERLDESLFRDFRDERGYIVHGLGSYLTVWTSIESGPNASAEGSGASGQGSQGQGGQGGQNGQPGQGENQGQGSGEGGEGGAEANFGVAVNVNTAPVAVLKALFDDRDVSPRFWDAVVEYRNLEEKDEGSEEEDVEPMLDEYGEEIVKRQFFDSLEELSEVDGYEDFGERTKNELSQLLSTQSRVFSIYVTARRKTGISDEDFGGYLGAPSGERRDDPRGTGLVRTIRSVVWRVDSGDGVVLVPIVRWEVLDYTPFEVLDYPDADR